MRLKDDNELDSSSSFFFTNSIEDNDEPRLVVIFCCFLLSCKKRQWTWVHCWFSFFANSIEDDNKPKLIIVIFFFRYDVILLKQHKQQEVGHACCPFFWVTLPQKMMMNWLGLSSFSFVLIGYKQRVSLACYCVLFVMF